MKVDFYGKVNIVDGKTKIDWDNPTAMVAQLIMLEDKRVRITITDELAEMSNQQRRYYWGHLISTLADGFGWDRDEMHDWLKAKFLSEIVHIKQPNGKVTETRKIPSMKKGGRNNDKKIKEFYTKIRMFGAENGYILREPNEEELSYDF